MVLLKSKVLIFNNVPYLASEFPGALKIPIHAILTTARMHRAGSFAVSMAWPHSPKAKRWETR